MSSGLTVLQKGSSGTVVVLVDITAPLTAIVEKSDAGEIDQAEAIQGIRTALALMGNASQYHAIQ